MSRRQTAHVSGTELVGPHSLPPCAFTGKRSRHHQRRILPLLPLLASTSNGLQPGFCSSLFQVQTRYHEAMQTNVRCISVRRPSSQRKRQRQSTTRLHVVTTPEAIIEQASTQKLLDDLIDESVRTSAKRPIMMQFHPGSGWIWRRWRGTVLSETWDACLSKMIYAMAIFLIFKTYPGLKDYLTGFNTLWGQVLSISTFTLTFFLNQSFSLWRKCLELSRRLQGRLHDLDMTLAIHAQRRQPSSPSEHSTYTPAARQTLELVSRYVRLFNLLTYASFTRSHRPILTPRGMRRLVERGLMTAAERQILVDCELPATQRHNAVLLWIVRTYVEGSEAGHFSGGAGFEQQFLEKMHITRSSYGAIGDELQGRMPLAYAHIVQVLVDLILFMYPVMAFSSGMSPLLTVTGTGLLTMSYQGLFDLAKQFLDPYDNESYGKGEDPIVVDTLIAETNAGSVRWLNGLEQMPVSAQKIKDGELSEYLLPVRGYSVEELAQMEEERLEREREQQERKAREEADRLKQEEATRRLRRAAKAMIPAMINETTSLPVPAFNVTYMLVNEKAKSVRKLPNLLKNGATISKADSVDELVQTIAVMAPGMTQPLIPEGTALADPPSLAIHGGTYRKKITTRRDENRRSQATGAAEGSAVDVDDDYDDDAFEVLEDWSEGGENYVHTFDSFEPYAELSWFDEIGPEGQEIRMSQILADEVWEEELEYQQEQEKPIKTFKDYVKKVAEIKQMEEAEYLETQEIMSAEPFAEYASKLREGKRVAKYDQTKLDGISQLWGLPPGELSEPESYKEPPLDPADDDFSTIAQLWGGTGADLAPNRKNIRAQSGIYADEEDDSFDSISQLWGQPIGDMNDSGSATRVVPKKSKDNSSSTSPVKATTRSSKDDGPRYVDRSEMRLSQVLADEVWEEEMDATAEQDASEEPDDVEAEPPTLEDYKKQVAEILQAERDEKLETEAILNAPPAADYLEEPDLSDGGESTPTPAKSQDDLSVLDMDAAYVNSTVANAQLDADDATPGADASAGELEVEDGVDTPATNGSAVGTPVFDASFDGAYGDIVNGDDAAGDARENGKNSSDNS